MPTHRPLVPLLAALAWPAVLAGAQAPAAPLARPLARPLHTFSIVAWDSATGQIGVAVQSHWFSVGSIVAWAEPGIGAVATQSFVLPAYGPRGLALMRQGVSGPDALRALLAADPDSQVRQVAMVDTRGRVLNHTGSRNIPAAGGIVGRHFAVQANLMGRPTVWGAMARAFETAPGDLADRLMAALDAAQREGGDIRGQQSAALIVVSGERTRDPWDRMIDIRVEDSPNPLGELRRLLRVARGYAFANKGDEYVTRNMIDSALAAYTAAEAILPDSAVNGELVFWRAVTLADRRRVDEAIPLFRRAFAQDTAWATLLWRLPRVGLLGADSTTLARIVREARPAPPPPPRRR